MKISTYFWDNLSKMKVKIFLGSLRIKDLNTLNQLLTKHYMSKNDALKECNGEYISFLDTDDYWLENDCLYKFR